MLDRSGIYILKIDRTDFGYFKKKKIILRLTNWVIKSLIYLILFVFFFFFEKLNKLGISEMVMWFVICWWGRKKLWKDGRPRGKK